jgi:hypothetical protein
MLKDKVIFNIPMYFEYRYIIAKNPIVSIKGHELILELPVKENIYGSIETTCHAREKNSVQSTSLK